MPFDREQTSYKGLRLLKTRLNHSVKTVLEFLFVRSEKRKTDECSAKKCCTHPGFFLALGIHEYEVGGCQVQGALGRFLGVEPVHQADIIHLKKWRNIRLVKVLNSTPAGFLTHVLRLLSQCVRHYTNEQYPFLCKPHTANIQDQWERKTSIMCILVWFIISEKSCLRLETTQIFWNWQKSIHFLNTIRHFFNITRLKENWSCYTITIW